MLWHIYPQSHSSVFLWGGGGLAFFFLLMRHVYFLMFSNNLLLVSESYNFGVFVFIFNNIA